MSKFISLAVFLLFVPLVASAQVGSVTFSPPAPTSQDVIQAAIQLTIDCSGPTSTIVVGTVVQTTITIDDCGVLPLGRTVYADFGPLSPNTYSHEVYIIDGGPPTLAAVTPLVVTAAAAGIPTLSGLLIVMLVAALGLVAMIVLRNV